MDPEKQPENLIPEATATETESKPKFEILEYTEEQKEALRKFYDSLREEFGKGEIFDSPNIDKLPEKLWLAQNERNEIVGTIGLNDCGQEVGYLKSLYIDKLSRRTGIASGLLSKAVEFAEGKGFRYVFGATNPKNDKIHNFLPKNGFEQVDTPPPNPYAFVPGTIFFQKDLAKKQ